MKVNIEYRDYLEMDLNNDGNRQENWADICKNIRRNILQISHKSGHGHVPTCFSVVELLAAVYGTIRHDPANPSWPERDLFILSKGHASLALYCTLAQWGYFPIEDVYTFGGYGSTFGCHADRHKVPGVEASTGSLGHGISLAVGMALAFQIQKSDRRVYTLIGDGESNEGTVWEALMVATNLGLSNLTILFDYNQSQTRSLPITNPVEKFQSFGCETERIQGHQVEKLIQALQRPTHKVKVLVADTTKGQGCPTLTDNMFEWHRKSPNEEQLQNLLQELDAQTI